MNVLRRLFRGKSDDEREERERWTLNTVVESEVISRMAKQIAKSYDYPVKPHPPRRRSTD